jgi:hypothetical protein
VARPNRQLTLLLIIACVLLCALFSVAFVCHAQGRPDLCLDPSDGPSSAPHEAPCALPVWDAQPLLAGLLSHCHAPGPALLPEDGANPALLGAVPGGLCLLI